MRTLFGPPFTSGAPHMGHALNFTIKDFIYTINDMKVDVRYDVHGLPVEKYVVSQNPKFSLKRDIDECEFISKSREVVDRNIETWKDSFQGSFKSILFDNPGTTKDPEYMLKVSKIFSKLYHKGMIKRTKKIQPYSAKACTSLSASEIEDSKIFKDMSAVFKFVIRDNLIALVWTTTPYTIFANMALCFSKKVKYGVFSYEEVNFIASVEYLSGLGVEYDDLNIEVFSMFYKSYDNGRKIIFDDDLVKEGVGTGIVHIAPAHGEEDFKLYTSLFPEDEILDFSTDEMKFTDEITEIYPDLKNLEYRDASPVILKIFEKSIFDQKEVEHSLKICPRTNSPIYYKLIDSIELDVKSHIDLLLEKMNEIDFNGCERSKTLFEFFIRSSPNWNLSRNRIWGNAIPMWENADGSVFVPKEEEIEEAFYIDNIKEYEGKRHLKFVFDCWFESGCQFEETPVDFIVEGVDQFRGWFRSLFILSVLSNGTVPYKTILANDFIVSSDGEKLSKTRKDGTPEITDALRMALISCSASNLTCSSNTFISDEAFKVAKNIIVLIDQKIDGYNFYAKTFKVIEGEVWDDYDNWMLNSVFKLEKEISELKYNVHLFPSLIVDFFKINLNRYFNIYKKKPERKVGILGTIILETKLRILDKFFLKNWVVDCETRKFECDPFNSSAVENSIGLYDLLERKGLVNTPFKSLHTSLECFEGILYSTGMMNLVKMEEGETFINEGETDEDVVCERNVNVICRKVNLFLKKNGYTVHDDIEIEIHSPIPEIPSLNERNLFNGRKVKMIYSQEWNIVVK